MSLDRENYGPSWFEILVVAWLGIALGVLLAAVHFMFKPVSVVTSLPKEPVPGEVYYIAGTVNPAVGKTWQLKQQMFVSGQSVSVQEEELNAAFASLTDRTPPPPPPPPPPPKPAPGAKPGAKPAPAPAPAPAAAPVPPNDDYLVPGASNYRIVDGHLQVALPVRIPSLDTTVQFQMTGHFEDRNGLQTFVPDTMHAGSLPMHLLPWLPGYVLGKLSEKRPLPSDFMESWARVKQVSFEGRQMNIVIP